jgi:alpha-glucosidase
VAAQSATDGSMLALYREGLAMRRHEGALRAEIALDWLPERDGVIAFDRGDVRCVTNLSQQPADLPPHAEVLLASDQLADGLLLPDTTAWLRT